MNGKYVKPMLFASKVSGEGVYLASGGGDYTLIRTTSKANQWYLTERYQIIFANVPTTREEGHATLRVEGANLTAVVAEANCSVTYSGNMIDVYATLENNNNVTQIAITCDTDGYEVSKA